MQSHSVTIRPTDRRCRYWAKIIRANESLPLPSEVSGAKDLPCRYAKHGDDELCPGDFLLEGEANHHRRRDRGWSYQLTFVMASGELMALSSGFSVQKKQMKEQGMATELLRGAGDVAAMVRIVHGVRAGMTISAE